jgi:hypothetical protein
MKLYTKDNKLILNENYLQKIIKGQASLSLVQIEMFAHRALIKIKDVFHFQYHSDIIRFTIQAFRVHSSAHKMLHLSKLIKISD